MKLRLSNWVWNVLKWPRYLEFWHRFQCSLVLMLVGSAVEEIRKLCSFFLFTVWRWPWFASQTTGLSLGSVTRLQTSLVPLFFFLISHLTSWTVASLNLNLSKQAACFSHFPLKATIVPAFIFLLWDLFLKKANKRLQKTEVLLSFSVFVFPRACECDMSRGAASLVRVFFRLCMYPNLVLSECSPAGYFCKHCNSL